MPPKSKRPHRQSRASVSAAPAPAAEAESPEVSAQAGGHSGGGGTNFAGAGTSPSRGTPAWGTLDTRFDTTASSQRELMRRSRALVANSGLARVLITISMMVGSQSPQMASTDTEWNRAAEAVLKFENGSALICDRAGQSNLESLQRLMEFLAMRDGDCFIELTKTESGRAAFRLHEGHVVHSQPPGSYGDRSWNQGIRFNEEGRPTHYYFEDPDYFAGRKGRVLPASSVIHYTYRDGVGVRGVSALAPAILHIIDIIERRGFTKAAIKLRAMIGLAIQQDVDGKPAGQKPLTTGLRNSPGSSPPDREGKVANAQDKGPKFEQLTFSGNTANVITFAPGQEAKILSDDSPNPNASQFENELLRDVAIGLQMPPQVIFWLEKQTGPMVRFTVRMAERRLAERRAHMRNVFLNRWIAYQVACAGKAERIFPAGTAIPDNWYACTWQEPASLTIDVGRDGNLELNQLDAGVASLDDVIGPAGGNWLETLEQKRREGAEIFRQAVQLMEDAKGLKQDVSFETCVAMIRNPNRAPQAVGPASPAAGKSASKA